MKVLNLYSGIGGNRKLWPKECEVTAVENNYEIARIYQDFFPQDEVIVADAHQFLLEHYSEFDFIWSSPPCPSHSNCNNFLNAQGVIRYPDMALYQEIIFLKHFFKGKWVIENVIPYYTLLIEAQKAERHMFWANFFITDLNQHDKNISITNSRGTTRRTRKFFEQRLSKYHGFDLSNYKMSTKTKLLSNCVRPELGLHIFNCAFREKQETLK